MITVVAIKQSSLLSEPTKGKKILDIPKDTVLEVFANTSNNGIYWYKVNYRGSVGWSYVGNFDPYSNTNEKNLVYLQDIQTGEPYDAEQYIMWENTSGDLIKCFNQCGEICVSYVLGVGLSEMLETWRESGSWYYQSVFNGSKDDGTGEAALFDLLGVMGESKAQSITDYFYDKYLDRVYLTPYRVRNCLEKNMIIFGVNIDNISGNLVTRNAVDHWIVLEDMTLNGLNGIVTIYNPFGNEMQQHSWLYLMEAESGIGGVVIPRGGAAYSPIKRS